jgi:threonine dehydratase
MLQHNSVAITGVQATQERILGIAHRIPVLTCRIVSDRTNSQVFFKCKNFGKVKVLIPNRDFR